MCAKTTPTAEDAGYVAAAGGAQQRSGAEAAVAAAESADRTLRAPKERTTNLPEPVEAAAEAEAALRLHAHDRARVPPLHTPHTALQTTAQVLR